MAYLVPFSSLRKDDIALAGGKGANLGELTHAGAPVPQGAVLTAPAYTLFLEQNGIDPTAVLAKEPPAALREQILQGHLPEAVRTELQAFLAENKGISLAVRSSATAEDLADASFAGQQETYLHVTGEDVENRILSCYASLWGDRAVAYRQHQGYTEPPALAVVLQQMVDADSAGVAFTRAPSGNPQELLIDAAYGLGEAVVSGLVTPDEYRLHRDGTLSVLTLGTKEKEIRFSPGGTETLPVSPERQHAQVLTPAQLRTLAACCLQAEAHYGFPLDIEWAFAGDHLYLLQARAITVQAQGVSPELLEKYPHTAPARGRMREAVLFNLEKTPMAYTPLDHDFAGQIGAQKGVLFEEYGITITGSSYPMDNDGISTLPKTKGKPNRRILHLGRSIRELCDHETNLLRADSALQEMREMLRNAVVPHTPAELGQLLEVLQKAVARLSYARFRYAMFPSMLLGHSLEKSLRRQDKSIQSYDLLEGLSYVTADVTRALSEIAQQVRTDPELCQQVSSGTWQSVSALPPIAPALQDFLTRFGAKSDYNCYCFAARSFQEDPDRLLQILRPMLKAEEPVPSLAAGLEKHKALCGRLLQGVKPQQRAKLKRKIEQFRRYHQVREESQYLWESAFLLCRRCLAALSECLQVPKDDLTLLFATELFSVCRAGRISPEIASILERRREMRPIAKALWERTLSEALAAPDGQIRGICGAPGQVEGRVCLVHGPEEFARLSKGDILVCPHTDPEWTPLFALAAGVIVDTGGSLSHAAIVAREYGIPALLATGNATALLSDGDRVLLSADSGTCTRL